jgi:hypothetical protein
MSAQIFCGWAILHESDLVYLQFFCPLFKNTQTIVKQGKSMLIRIYSGTGFNPGKLFIIPLT